MEPEQQEDEKKRRKWPIILLFSAVVLGGGGLFAHNIATSQNSATPGKIQVPLKKHTKKKSSSDSLIDSATGSSKGDKQSKSADDLVDSLLGGDGASNTADEILKAIVNPVGAVAKAVTSDTTKKFVALAAKALADDDDDSAKKSADKVTVTDASNEDATLTPLDNVTGTATGDQSTPVLPSDGGTTTDSDTTTPDTGGSDIGGDSGQTTPVKVDRAPVILALGSMKFHAHQGNINYLTGVVARDVEDGNLVNAVQVDASGVDTNTPGTYWVNYSVTDSAGHTTSVKREVVIYNDAPVLYVTHAKTSIEVGTSFNAMSGVIARDFQDGNLAGRVAISGSVDTSKLGVYDLSYQVADSNGATATAKQEVTVFADKPTLDISKIPTTIKVGEHVQVHDVTASSKYGDISIELIGGIDSNTPGQYKLTYTVTDKFGQQTTASTTVTVQSSDTSTTSDSTEGSESSASAVDSDSTADSAVMQ